jgi:hypothetical protein
VHPTAFELLRLIRQEEYGGEPATVLPGRRTRDEERLVATAAAQALGAAQAAVRAQSAEERHARGAKLAAGPTSAAAGAREWGTGGATVEALDPAHPYFWGLFIHVGI